MQPRIESKAQTPEKTGAEARDGSGIRLNRRVFSALKSFSRFASLAVILIGCVVVTGWIFDAPVLKHIFPHLVSMKANTATSFILAGFSLYLLRTESPGARARLVAQACALVVLLIGLLTLSEYLFGRDLSIDQLLFSEAHDSVTAEIPGRMAPVVAFNLVLLGSALLCLAARRELPAQLLTLPAAVLSLVALSGYVYGVESLYRVSPFSATALHTAIGCLLLCGGILFARPDRGPVVIVASDTAGGLLTRRLLPAAIIIPPILGWVRLKGQDAGLYDTRFGVALLTLADVAVFSVLIWWSALLLGRMDERRRRAQDSLIDSNERLRLAVEATKLGTWDLNPQTGERRWSDQCRAIFELPAGAEVNAEQVYERIHPSDQAQVREAVRLALQPGGGDELRVEYRTAVGEGGEERWVESRGRAFFEGNTAVRLIGTLLDITERKQAEEALREAVTRAEQNRAQLEAIIQAVNDGIMVSDMAGNFLLANEAEARIAGYDSVEEVRQNLDFYVEFFELTDSEGNLVPVADWPLSKILRGETVTEWELKCRRRDTGQEWYFSFSGKPVYDERGEPVLAVIITHDMTERKQLEEQLVQSQKMDAIGRLAGGVAHDFNNLLTVILGYSEMLMKRLPPDDRGYSQAEEIEKAGRRAAALTNQLLAFSRRQVMRPEILNLNAVIADIGKMLQRVIGEDIQLRTNLDIGISSVKADPGQIEQIIMNLAVNARDAMPAGGHLTIETQNAYLDENYASQHAEVSPGPYVMFAISDTGVGMNKQIQARIFEPFFTTKAVGKGTGLGLATVYGIVKQSGGHIWVYSEPGVGTSFKIYFPQVEGRAEKGKKRESLEPPRGSETILLVEDEEVVRNLTRHILQLSGYQVLEAANGDEAFALGEQVDGVIHLLLTDVIMPGLSGRALAERLQAARPSLRVLYMSGYTDEAIGQHGMLEPGVALLEKPFTPDSLAHRVRAVLDEKEP